MSDAPYNRIGLNIKMYREAMDYTQATLARAMSDFGHDWSQPTVTRVESGQRIPTLLEAESLARILRVGFPALLAEQGSRPFVRELRQASARVTETARHASVELDNFAAARERVTSAINAADESPVRDELQAEIELARRAAADAVVTVDDVIEQHRRWPLG